MRHLLMLSLASVALVSASPFLSKRDTCTTNDLNIPSDGMKLKNGLPFGFGPDEEHSGSMSQINQITKKKGSTYTWYTQINNDDWDGSQLTEVMDDLKSSGAVFIPAVMPEIPFNQIDSTMANKIAGVVKQFTDNDIEVWLRFGHEMNCYVSASCSGSSTAPYSGTPEEFVTAWQNVHAAVADIDNCLMFWSPNTASAANISAYWPGANYVDIVGLDYYLIDGQKPTFESAYGDFYNTYAKGWNKHFVIGETGAKTSDVSQKEYWLQQLAAADTSTYPCFQAATWFEYAPDPQYGQNVDFRIFVGQSSDTVSESLSNFE